MKDNKQFLKNEIKTNVVTASSEKVCQIVHVLSLYSLIILLERGQHCRHLLHWRDRSSGSLCKTVVLPPP